MIVSEFCIRRPVFTILLMVSLLVIGVAGYMHLPISALPNVDFPTIQVTATLPGASPESMAATIATPLEREFSSILGIDTITSSSTTGSTQITVQFQLDRDLDGAALDIQTAIAAAQSKFPKEMTSPPRLRKVNPADQPIFFIAMSSDILPATDVNEYADTFVAQRISTIKGVSQVSIYGAQKRAIRVRINPELLAGRDLTMGDIARSVQNATSIIPPGLLMGKEQLYNLDVIGQPFQAAQFNSLIISKTAKGGVVRLQDIGTAVQGIEDDRNMSFINGKQAVTLAIQRQPDSNTVEIVDKIKKLLPQFKEVLPASIELVPLFDRSISIRDSIHDVQVTLAIAVFLVILVIFLFLRQLTATLIPFLALPFSLIATCGGMAALGFSFNNISLLALTLSVGYVVDDAIVMLENITRYREKGLTALEAALEGSKEIGFTIVSITLSLVAVFIPLLFMGGLIGRIFFEFSVTISMAILISGVVSLTLTPMLCRYVKGQENPFSLLLTQWFQNLYEKTLKGYEKSLSVLLSYRKGALYLTVFSLFLTLAIGGLAPKGFFPLEDTGFLVIQTEASQDISFNAMVNKQAELEKMLRQNPFLDLIMSRIGGSSGATNTGRMFVALKPLGKRPSMEQMISLLRQDIAKISGINAYIQPIQNLNIGGRLSKGLYQYTLQGLYYDELKEWAERLQEKLKSIEGIVDLTTDLQLNSLQLTIKPVLDKAEFLGITPDLIRRELYYSLGQAEVGSLYTQSNNYKIILEVDKKYQESVERLKDLYVRTSTGQLVEIDSIANFSMRPAPLSVNHQGQLPAVTLSFNLKEGASLGTVTQEIKNIEQQMLLPPTIIPSFQGTAQVFESSKAGMGWLFLLSVVVMYIILGMLYENFIHPITILSGLPSATIGAIIALIICGKNLDLIAFIGIIMLVGIVKKNGIMMVDFAITMLRQGMPADKAIYEACLTRFRPIMMTTLSALLGVLPIAFAMGAGAEVRQPLGIAVVGGLITSQFLTLYITPVIYLYLERFVKKI